MSYNYVKNLTTVNYSKGNDGRKYVVIHYTGNKNDKASSNAEYFKSVNRGASAHYFVDKTSVYQVVNDDDTAWAVGKNYGSNNLFGKCTNRNSISIEMCSDNGKIHDKTYKNTVELTKKLMKKYNIPVSNVVRHYDVCSKTCPGWNGWVGSDTSIWNKFKKDIFNNSSSTSSKPSTSTSTTYSHKQFVKDIQSAIGAKVDGIAGNETLSKTITVSKTKNNKHKVVKPIQKYLNSLGYSCGTVDGIFGSKTESSVKSFQSKNGCVLDGIITSRKLTWKKLLKLK